MFGHYSHYSCDTVLVDHCLIFEISEILWQYGATAARHSQSSVPECPTFLVKISHDELCVQRCMYSVHCMYIHGVLCTM